MDLVDIDKVLDDLELNESANDDVSSIRIRRDGDGIGSGSIISNTSSTSTSTSSTAAIAATSTILQQESYNSLINNKILLNDNYEQNQQQQQNINNDLIVGNNSGSNNYNNHLKTTTSTSTASTIKTLLDETEHNYLMETKNNNQKLLIASATTTSIINNKNIEDDRGVKNKKFVTVSNVFSSLDDYRRDVESLRQKTHKADDDNDTDNKDEDNSNNEDCNYKKNKKENEKIIDQSMINQQNSNNDLTKSLEFENSKNVIDNIEYEPEDIGCTITTSTSSSITTSSPSSFSSGPSPGSPVSDESCSFIVDNDNDEKRKTKKNNETEIKNDDNNDGDDEEESDFKEHENFEKQKEIDSKFEKQQKSLDKPQKFQQQQDGNNKESLELGLSSISSYLYCENVSSSLPCSSQDMRFDALSSMSSSQTQNIIDDEEKHKIKNNRENKNHYQYQQQQNQGRLSSEDEYGSGGTGGNNLPYHKISSPPIHQQKQKVVGFGSTMDEISDTELDSILQEIDNDFQMYYTPQPSAITTTTSEGVSLITNEGLNTTLENKKDDSDKKDFIVEQSTTNITAITTSSKLPSSIIEEAKSEKNENLLKNKESVNVKPEEGASSSGNDGASGGEIFSSIQQFPQASSVEDENNLQNADSFSQASTIEFADLRLHTDFEVDMNDDKSITATGGSNSVSDQTVESGVSSETNFNLKNSNMNNVENDYGKSNLEKENGEGNEKDKNPKYKKDDPNTENLNERNVSATIQSSQHFQRPNSLDLPTQMDVKMYINSTAGQTPPASRLDDISLLSTSSSDDQQLSLSDQNDIITANSQHQQSLSQEQQQTPNKYQLGKVPPFWIPDSEASACMQCKQKFSLIKRRHHCRACGQVLCSVCCSQKAKLVFMGNAEARICIQCSIILNEKKPNDAATTAAGNKNISTSSSSSSGENGINTNDHNSQAHRSPNPNNPMEYCSMISPYQQVGHQSTSSPISVMVPVGVLKREGAPKSGRKDKNVIFSDGIRPGCDLTELDNNWDLETGTGGRIGQTSSSNTNNNNNNVTNSNTTNNNLMKSNDNNNSEFDNSENTLSNNKQGTKRIQTKATQRNINSRVTKICDETESYIPKELNNLPPICITNKTETKYMDVQNNLKLIERLEKETLKFAIQRNLFVFVKIVKLKCCVNKTIINFSTQGMHHVGQDEIIILLELDNSNLIPKDIFVHLNEIYKDAEHGLPISELGFSMPKQTNFLGSREHGGFLYIRPTFQCLQEIHLPESPYLIGILIHRWEVPWAKIFPLRLMLRLGAEYRYYPSPHISIRGRNSVYAEIAQTIINFLADFRNYSYTLATIRGMYVHMEDRRTNILIPRNRYDQVIKALNNSSDHILALGANFSKKADGHLVCMQNMEADCPETHTYSTQAINIQGQARKVTGASFIVFNGALKTSSGLTGKCNIVEDGLMVQILPAKMQAVRNALKNMKDIDIICGPNDVDESQTEIVSIKWTENDCEFNIGVKSPIDGNKMDGIPSIRVHSGLNYSNKNHIIRWTEVFVIQFDEDSVRSKDPIDISKIAEQIAKSTSIALVSFLDLLAANECLKIGLRATLHQESVCYEAGSKNTKLPPLYMNALDNELIPILHKQATSLDIDSAVILELIFNILNK